MNKDQIKQYLFNNPEEIVEILENIGCHSAKIIKNKRVQCALPSGDNKASVQILLDDEYLNAVIHTKNEFSKYEVKDIYSVIQFIKECSLNEAINIVCKVCNIKHSSEVKKKSSSSAYSFLKSYVRDIKKEEKIQEDNVLDESFMQRFIRVDCELYLLDGVSSQTQAKFGVSYDVLDNRIVIPIRNDDGKLITFKGRTHDKDYKIKGIPKFINYYPAFNNNYLFGLYENYYDILLAEEVLVIEAEKGVLQADSMEINNVVAVNKKKITDTQVKKLLKLGKPVILAFDKDVTLEQIFIECRKFKGLIDVYYIFDTLELLGEKQSPTDRGIDIYKQLIEHCKFKYKGE